jgi:hypothetical protein
MPNSGSREKSCKYPTHRDAQTLWRITIETSHRH